MTHYENDHVELEQLGDWMDGRLSPEQQQAVERHLDECPSCNERRDRLQSLVGAASTLPAEIEPPPALWNQIHARIAPVRLRHRQRWLLAAAAVLLVAVSSAVTALLVRRPPLIIVRQPPPASISAAAIPPLVRAVDADYATAIRELDETLAEHRRQLDPATVAKVEASLQVIDLAIDEARHALAADPSNLTLHDLLTANYERKLELLRRASTLLPRT